jgi:sugar transferase
VKQGKPGVYARYIKRILDVLLSGCALVVLTPVLLIVAVLVRTKLGSPIIFCQERPGKDEKIFKMYKFRSMTDARGENGELLPDEVRLTKFGRALRSTSLDELPELWNIFKGDMSIVGPRPQLVRDMVFMTPEQRLRHTVMPGLTGLAQVSGRNAISWEDKLATDLRYIRRITFLGDVKIVLLTVKKVFCREDISADGMDTAEDLGDYLLRTAQVSEEAYQELQAESKALLLTAGK